MRHETFTPYVATKGESFEYIVKKRPISGFRRTQGRRRPQVIEEEEEGSDTLFLEVLVITSTVVLWTTTVVLLIFSGYLLSKQKGLSLIFDLLTSIVLQMIGSLFLAVSAALTCACHNPTKIQVPKLSKSAIIFLVLSFIILASVIFTSVTHIILYDAQFKSKLHEKLKKAVHHDIDLKIWNILQQELSCCGVESKDDWIKNGMKAPPMSCCKKTAGEKCEKWKENGCLEPSVKLKKQISAFLTGSASIALANCIIILPILVKLFLQSKIITKDLRQLQEIKKQNKRLEMQHLNLVSSLDIGSSFSAEPSKLNFNTLQNMINLEKEKKAEKKQVSFEDEKRSQKRDTNVTDFDANNPTPSTSKDS